MKRTHLERRLFAVVLAITLVAGQTAFATQRPGSVLNGESARYATRLPGAGDGEITLMVQVQSGGTVAFEHFIGSLGGRITAALGLSWFDVSLPVEQLDRVAACPQVTGIILPRAASLDSAGTQAQPDTPPAPAASFSVTAGALSASYASQLQDMGLSGRDVVIAVIDTGVDPGHSDLQSTPLGESKLIDWVDFTGQGIAARRAAHAFGTSPAEGDISTAFSALPAAGHIVTSSGEVRVPVGQSRSGIYHYGFIDTEQLGLPAGPGLGKVVAAVVDPVVAGTYEELYVDSDGDLDLTDETPIGEFATTGDVGWLGDPGGDSSLAFVATEIVDNGRMVNLGFDGNGHGTHVAGVAAANGLLRGVAPGAQIMALKALKSNGEGSWDNISRAMIYAAENGANIINISIGSVAEARQSLTAENQLMRDLADTYGVLIVVAAGNNGPAVGSIGTPGDPQTTLTVGAYMTSELWDLAYGLRVPGSSLWHFSAVGPRSDGSMGPNLVAPGVAYSTVPRATRSAGYQVLEGTSMAVPFVSGGAALLWEAARLEGREPTSREIKRSLELGATPLNGHLFIEQGYGAVNLQGALQELRDALAEGLSPGGPVDVTVAPEPDGKRGVFVRGDEMGSRRFIIRNSTSKDLLLDIAPGVPGVTSNLDTMHLVPDSTRQLHISYPDFTMTGVTEFMVTGNDPSTFGPDLLIPHTIITPIEFALPVGALGFSDHLAPNQLRRYFVEVPPGSTKLRIQLAVPGTSEQARGRVEAHVIGPSGYEWANSDTVGRDRQTLWNKELAHPEAGTWEVAVQAQPDLSHYQLESSDFELRLELEGIEVTSQKASWVTPGSSTSSSMTLRAFGATFTGDLHESPLALVSPAGAGQGPVVKEQARVMPSEPFFEEFDLDGSVDVVELVIENCSTRPIPELTLYRYDESGNPVEVAQGEEAENGSRISARDLEPGRYLAWVSTGEPGGVSVQYRRTTVAREDHLKLNLSELVVAPSFSLSLEGTLLAPEKRGRYVAYVVLMSEEGSSVLATIPVEVMVGPPAVLLQVRPLINPGGIPVRARVVMRDRDSKQCVEVPVRVNGRTYQGYAGTGELEVAVAAGSTFDLQYRDPLLGWISERVTWPGTQADIPSDAEQTQKTHERTKLRTLVGRRE